MPHKQSRSKFNQYPLFWLAICLAFGILVSNNVDLDMRFSLAMIAGAAFLAMVLIRRKLAFIFVFIAFVGAGVFCFQIEKQRNSENRLRTLYDEGVINSADPVEIEGTLTGSPEQTVGGEFLTVRVDQVVYRGVTRSVRGNVKLSLATDDAQAKQEADALDLKYGSRVRFA